MTDEQNPRWVLVWDDDETPRPPALPVRSLEDELMRLFATGAVSWVMDRAMPEGEPIEAKMVSKAIERAQKQVEDIPGNRVQEPFADLQSQMQR